MPHREHLQQEPAEQARKHADGEEESGPARDPALALERDATTRHAAGGLISYGNSFRDARISSGLGEHLGASIGITAVLHTWGSALTYHPHVHMIVANSRCGWIAAFHLIARVGAGLRGWACWIRTSESVGELSD